MIADKGSTAQGIAQKKRCEHKGYIEQNPEGCQSVLIGDAQNLIILESREQGIAHIDEKFRHAVSAGGKE